MSEERVPCPLCGSTTVHFCRTASHLHDAASPAWHKRPTVPGLWVWRAGTPSADDLSGWRADRAAAGYYGPIPLPPETT